jgi:hypothetical protein
LPHTTPHTLRRTYISIALLANTFDVKWVMGQVGHADSKMTLDVYAQLEQRVDRSHGTSFDALIRHARGHADTSPKAPVRADRHRFGTGNGTNQPMSNVKPLTGRRRQRPENGKRSVVGASGGERWEWVTAVMGGE